MDYDKQNKGPDDVEKSLELLDKVLSEFEDPDSLPPVEQESPSQGHQSEDDGYMSMNGRRAKFAPDFQPTDESCPPDPSIQQNESSALRSPPPPEEAERIISNLIPKITSPSSTIGADKRNNGTIETSSNVTLRESNFMVPLTPSVDITIRNDVKTFNVSENILPLDILPSHQTTLPKTRPSPAKPFRFASLPSTSPPRGILFSSDSLDDGRTVLGMGISAVHDAVLRGIARMPDTIVNEHPVTIYPGRASPQRKIPPRTLPGSKERHREVCRNPESGGDSPSSSSPENIINELDLSPPPSAFVSQTIFLNSHLNRMRRKGSRKNNNDDDNENSEDFSDDSLEDNSLPPPPPPPVIPPPPSLSCPVTPSKRSSIAWDINLDDLNGTEDLFTKSHRPVNTKIFVKQRVSGSQSSLASTPGQSTTSNKRFGSMEWPDPPEPPVCSTEDEAASIYSDSDELNQYPSTHDMSGRGTYVIRKGRKQRQRLSQMDSMSSINSKLSNEELNTVNIPSPVFPSSLMMPNSRHSVDLGTTSPPASANIAPPYVQNSLNSPRSRLSLDLSSPTSELPANTNTTTSSTIISPRFTEFKSYSSTFDGLQALENINNSNNNISIQNGNNNNNNNTINGNGLPLMRVSSLPTITPPLTGDSISTPRRELAPPIEEDEEQDSESQHGAPLRQIENNISALLRGDIPLTRVSVSDIHPSTRRAVGFRPGVHKSESAKEMLLAQQQAAAAAAAASQFGPLPPSPQSSSPEFESDGFPPLPPSPTPADPENYTDIMHDIHNIRVSSRTRSHKTGDAYYRDTIDHAPMVPPHRGPSVNTLKTRSMDAGFSKSYKNGSYISSPHTPGTLPPELPGSTSRRRLTSGAFPKRSAQSPREERRLQTSCSLPETPIFARGHDISRTPHRRAPDLPGTGSRTAPRQTPGSGMSSIVGIGGGRQSISQALATGEMLRMTGGPARGWYPKQRHQRPVSTENLDRLHPQGSMRAWDSAAAGTASRKPLTLPPNLTPKFFNKSPREALRRVTSLLIRKGHGGKEDKHPKKDNKERDIFATAVHRSPGSAGDVAPNTTPPVTAHKKKGFFKSFWKKSKHYSLEQ